MDDPSDWSKTGIDKKTGKGTKDGTPNTKELKKEVEAMTTAVGYKGAAKTKATEVMMLNSKQNEPLSTRERKEQQETLKTKVNMLFDMRASDPLIINSLKRKDSIFDKVKLLNENYFNNGRESLKKKRQDVIAEAEDEENERDRAVGEQSALLTTEGNADDSNNNNYFRNMPAPPHSGSIPKESEQMSQLHQAKDHQDYDKANEEDKTTENVEEDDEEEEKASRLMLYEKSRRSMSMINPAKNHQIQNLLMAGQ